MSFFIANVFCSQRMLKVNSHPCYTAIDAFDIKEKLHTVHQYKIVGTSKINHFSIIIFTMFKFHGRTDCLNLLFTVLYTSNSRGLGCAEKETDNKNGLK